MNNIFKKILRPSVRLFFRIKKDVINRFKLIGHYHPKVQKRIGNSDIRFLGDGDDGGFYINLAIVPANGGVLYSFGVGRDISFDLAVHKIFPKIEIRLFDPTPDSAKWIHGLELPDNMYFQEIGISNFDGIEEMFIPKDKNLISGSVYYRDTLDKKAVSVEMSKLSSIMKRFGHKEISVLKMDIEGSEFKVISDIMNEGVTFRQLCIEVHNRFFDDGDDRLKDMITTLNNNGYYITKVSRYEDVLLFENFNM